MFKDHELLDIELRNRGNADVERLLAYVRWSQRKGLNVPKQPDYRAIDTSQPGLLS
jgi:hypothetical protein